MRGSTPKLEKQQPLCSGVRCVNPVSRTAGRRVRHSRVLSPSNVVVAPCGKVLIRDALARGASWQVQAFMLAEDAAEQVVTASSEMGVCEPSIKSVPAQSLPFYNSVRFLSSIGMCFTSYFAVFSLGRV